MVGTEHTQVCYRLSPCGDKGLGNSRFHTLLFGINRLRSDKLPHCWAKSHCSGAFVQLLCNQNFNGLSCRCTPIMSANDGVSCRFAIFRRAARKCPDQSRQARLSVLIRRTNAPSLRVRLAVLVHARGYGFIEERQFVVFDVDDLKLRVVPAFQDNVHPLCDGYGFSSRPRTANDDSKFSGCASFSFLLRPQFGLTHG